MALEKRFVVVGVQGGVRYGLCEKKAGGFEMTNHGFTAYETIGEAQEAAFRFDKEERSRFKENWSKKPGWFGCSTLKQLRKMWKRDTQKFVSEIMVEMNPEQEMGVEVDSI